MINIIGGSGFVGTKLVSVLVKSNCSILDKVCSPFYPEITNLGDIRNIEKIQLSRTKNDSVVLLAAEHKDDVNPISLYYDVNVTGTKNVLQKKHCRSGNASLYGHGVTRVTARP